MTKCPYCGVELADSLVTAIKDQNQPESCPKSPKAKEQQLTSRGAARTLAAFMLLASVFEGEAAK